MKKQLLIYLTACILSFVCVLPTCAVLDNDNINNIQDDNSQAVADIIPLPGRMLRAIYQGDIETVRQLHAIGVPFSRSTSILWFESFGRNRDESLNMLHFLINNGVEIGAEIYGILLNENLVDWFLFDPSSPINLFSDDVKDEILGKALVEYIVYSKPNPVKKLLDYGARPNFIDDDGGRTALQLAEYAYHNNPLRNSNVTFELYFRRWKICKYLKRYARRQRLVNTAE